MREDFGGDFKLDHFELDASTAEQKDYSQKDNLTETPWWQKTNCPETLPDVKGFCADLCTLVIPTASTNWLADFFWQNILRHEE